MIYLDDPLAFAPRKLLTVTVRQDVLAQLDRLAAHLGLSRSRTVEEILKFNLPVASDELSESVRGIGQRLHNPIQEPPNG